MADKDVKIKVTQEGLSEIRSEAKATNAELDKLSKPRVVQSATRTGSRAADAALSTSDTGMQRGTTGAGGRGGERDFARQAQGLGGLVHLYATFAANIYAVGAAFDALQKAADFDRMEQSAAKLSSTLGINLKAAAQNMVLLTDGTVSYGDAIEKTNLAASAGLSSKQIAALTQVARDASSVLGRDMGDSLNRLVKGTVKLEPELLDELGILTKASEAYNKYALSIGKSADDLTKFEKTQAFVNAVIDEGKTKFADIYGTVPPNPYTKLQASLQNLQQTTLSVINTGLGPIANLLASSPTGLAAAIALVVGKLAKLAMPELLAGLATRVERASSALETSSAKFKTANEAVFKSFEQTVGYATISSNSKSKILKEASQLRKQLNDSILTDFELTPSGEQVKYSAGTTKLIDEYEKKLSNYKNRLEGRTDLGAKSTRDLAGVKQELLLLQDMKKSYADLANNEQIAGSARNKENRATLELMKANKALRVTELIMDGEHLSALKLAYTLEAQITKEKMSQSRFSVVQKAAGVGGVIGGAIGAAGTAAMTLATKLPALAATVGTAAAVYEAAKWAFGEAKSMKELDAAVEAAADSHTQLAERIQVVNKLMQSGSSDGYAKAQQLLGTAITENANRLSDLYESYRKVQAELSGENRTMWTTGSEAVLSLFGKDTLTTDSKAFVSTMFDTMAQTTSEESPALRKAIADALKIDISDVDNIDIATAAVRRLFAAGDIVAVENLQKKIRAVGSTYSSLASQITEASNAVALANKEAKAIDTKATLKNVKYSGLYESALGAAKDSTTGGKETAKALFGGMDTELKDQLSKTSPVLNKFFKDIKNSKDISTVVGFTDAVKALPSAVTKLKGKGDVSPDMSFPKDRLRSEKATLETLKHQLALIEQERVLNEQNLQIATERFGLAGEQYDALLDEKVGLFAASEAQKYYNSLKEAELKKEESILGIQNDKNTMDKPGAIAKVNEEYDNQVKLVEKVWEVSQKRIENEVQITALKKIQRNIDVEASKASLAASGATYGRTRADFRRAAMFSAKEADALQEQIKYKGQLIDKTNEEFKGRYDSKAYSMEINKLLTEQIDLATKLYEIQRVANAEAIKAFELTGMGGPSKYLANFGNEISFQVTESLKNARSGADVLIGGVITGIDNTINELTMRLKEGNLSISDLVNFARNQLADAFQQSAAQVLQNGWKQVLTQLVPAAADPLTIATSTASANMMFLSESINALNVTLGGTAVTGGGAGAGFWGGLFGSIFGKSGAPAGAGALTAPNNLALNTAVAPVTMTAANGGLMTEYGPLKLNKYSKGGIANSPQAAIYGEGSKSEAYVPLPDNRTIPVTLNGNTGANVSVGDTTINVTVESNGNTQVDSKGTSEMAKSLSLAIKKTVHEEIMNQVRPGGMFYGR